MFGVLFLIALIIVLLIVKYHISRKRNSDYFKNRGVPTCKLSFSAGLYNMLTKSPAEFLALVYSLHENDRFFGWFFDNKPALFMRDPALIQKLAIKDFDHFMDHGPFIDPKVDPFFNSTLINLKGQKWREMRTMLSPAFTGSKMRLMFELVSECADQMITYLNEKCEEHGPQTYDMKDICSKVTNDMIATCAFGVKCDSLRDPRNVFYTTGMKVMDFQKPVKLVKFLFAKLLPDWIGPKLLDIKIIGDKTVAIFSEIILSTMKARQERNIIRPDMINMLMDVRKGQPKLTKKTNKNDSIAAADDSEKHTEGSQRILTDDELIPQCFNFYFGGFDSTASLLTFTSYELAINPNVQKKLQEEIAEMDAQLSGQPLTYDCIQKMPYLDMVITESLRKWPLIFGVDRVCVKDYEYVAEDGKKFTIEKGVGFLIPIFGMHRDPKYYPDPEIFDPERFSQENKSKIDFNAYIPFGVGPRNCIGSRFALMQSKALLYYLLLNFTFEVCDETPIPLKLKKAIGGLVPVKFKLMLTPRNK